MKVCSERDAQSSLLLWVKTLRPEGDGIGLGKVRAASQSLKLAKISNSTFQIHHIIPNKVYKTFKKDLKSIGWKQNDKWNLKKLPTPFHGNHPKYNDYVITEINKLKATGNFNIQSMKNLQHRMRIEIGDAYRSGKISGENLNDYFR